MNIVGKEYILIFSSYNRAVFLYNKFLRMGYKVELISTPCKITPGCTQSVKFSQENFEVIKQYVKENGVGIKGIYEIVIKGRKFDYVKVI